MNQTMLIYYIKLIINKLNNLKFTSANLVIKSINSLCTLAGSSIPLTYVKGTPSTRLITTPCLF